MNRPDSSVTNQLRPSVEAGGTEPLILEAKSQGLGLFIRSLVGLDREAATQAFGDFINSTAATANQIEFVNLIVQELTQTGVMESDRLFQSPFTDLNAQGPLALFPPARVTRLVERFLQKSENGRWHSEVPRQEQPALRWSRREAFDAEHAIELAQCEESALPFDERAQAAREVGTAHARGPNLTTLGRPGVDSQG